MMDAHAGALTGRVVRVIDGDTLEVLDAERTPHRVRLAAIDTPERGQPFGKRARQALGELVAGADVTVEFSKTDRWGRLIGTVFRDGEDVNAKMLARGLAWHYKRYEGEQSPRQRAGYAKLETQAKAARLGLWSDDAPIAPWTWRRQNGH